MSVLTFRTHIVFISYLQNDFVERFFLLRIADFIIIVFDFSVCSCLLIIVPFQCFIKQFVIDFLDIFIAIIYIEVSACRVNICRFKLAAVVID